MYSVILHFYFAATVADDTQEFLLSVCIIIPVIVVFLVCLYQNSTVKQRYMCNINSITQLHLIILLIYLFILLLLPQVFGAFSVLHARCCARSCKQQVGQRVYPRQGKRIKVKKNSGWTASLIVRHLSSCL